MHSEIRGIFVDDLPPICLQKRHSPYMYDFHAQENDSIL